MIAGAMWFNSGILLFADAEMDDRGEVRADSHTILSKHYGAHSDGASSVFVLSEPGNRHTSEFHHCEEVIASIPPEDCTLERMREASRSPLSIPVMKRSISSPCTQRRINSIRSIARPERCCTRLSVTTLRRGLRPLSDTV